MAEELGVLCRNLPELLAVATETGDRHELDEILDAARRGEPVAERLKDLGLSGLLESWTSRAVPDTPTPAAGLVSLPGTGGGGHVALGDYRCPARVCPRTERPRPGDGPPQCAVHGMPLTFVTL